MDKNKITKDMLIGDLVQKYPESGNILFNYGLHCIGCMVSLMETIEQGCKAHGMDDDTIDRMVDDLNVMASNETQQKAAIMSSVKDENVKTKSSKKASAKSAAKKSNKKSAAKRSKK